MKFKVSIPSFKEGLNEIKDTIGSDKSQREGLRLFADAKGRVRLTTNDGSYATDTWISADVEVEGEFILTAKLFHQYFNRLDGKDAEITLVEPTKLQVKTKRGKQIFHALEDTHFEMIVEAKPESETDISGKIFKQMINAVAFASSDNSKERPVLEGIHLLSNGKMTQLSTTDGHSIASIKKKVILPKLDLVLGKKTLMKLARSVRDDEKVTFLNYTQGISGVRVNETTYTFPQYQGKFPDSSRVINSINPKTFATVDKLELIALLERASLLCENTAFMKIDGAKLTIKGSNAYGQFNEFMFAGVQGEPIEVRFAVDALTKMVKNIQHDNVEIGLEKGKPIVCSPDSKLNQVCVLAAMA